MATVNITITLASAGTDAGPFDITDNLGNTLATGVTAAQLLAGYVIAVDDSITTITVCSTGTCDNCRSVDVNLSPVLGNCISYRFELTNPPDSGCRSYRITADPDISPNTSFQGTPCGTTTPQTYTLSPSQSITLCLESPPTGGQISYTQTDRDCGYFETTITYTDCEGLQKSAVISTNSAEVTLCAIEGEYSVNESYVTVTNYGACPS
jgi:hypothetical protein